MEGGGTVLATWRATLACERMKRGSWAHAAEAAAAVEVAFAASFADSAQTLEDLGVEHKHLHSAAELRPSPFPFSSYSCLLVSHLLQFSDACLRTLSLVGRSR
jgi:hypothetical protein